MRIPDHIGIIPDGNRRWAESKKLNKKDGYKYGLEPGLKVFKLCKKLGVKELTFYGFTMENTKRPSEQTKAFKKACINAVKMLAKEDASLLVVGNRDTPMFPEELIPYTERTSSNKDKIKVNFLINYGWQWDLKKLNNKKGNVKRNKISNYINSNNISRVDLIIRWGYRRRLSGFLPVQSIYADFYVVDEFWPDYKADHLYNALKWYDKQDLTYGG